MSLTLKQFSRELSQDLASLYVFYGDELLLQMEAVDLLRATAYQRGYRERQIFTVESNFSWSELTSNTQNYSLFSAKQLIELRIPSGKPGVPGAIALQNHAQQQPEDQLLIITLPRLDKATLQSKWFKALETNGVTIPTPPLEPTEWMHWLEERLANQQQTATTEALQFLAGYTEGNLLAAKQEIEKLGLLYPKGELTLAQLSQATTSTARYDLAQFSEAWLKGDAARALSILAYWQESGEPIQLIIWQLADDLQNLALAQREMATGISMQQAVRKVRVWGSRLGAFQQALQRLKPTKLASLLEKIAVLDRISKGGTVGWDRYQKPVYHPNPWETAKVLIVEISANPPVG